MGVKYVIFLVQKYLIFVHEDLNLLLKIISNQSYIKIIYLKIKV